MKAKIILQLLTTLIVLFLPFQETFASEIINDFNAYIRVNTNGVVGITERITYDFGTNQKHGIIREIPINKINSDGKEYKMEFRSVTVNAGMIPYKTFINNNLYTFQIGDENKLVTGRNQYDIRYAVYGAVTYFTDHDELYWNITGNLSGVPTEEVSAQIDLPPKAAYSGVVKAECYTGLRGETRRDCSTTVMENKILVSTTLPLNAKEGLTVVIGFPKGIVETLEPKEAKSIDTSFIEKIVSYLFGALLVVLALFWYLYYPFRVLIKSLVERKNNRIKERIVAAWFESPETLNKRTLTPAETGTLVDKNTDYKDVSATIIDLAQRGFLRIKVIDKKETILQKLIDFTQRKDLMDFERNLLNGIFSNGVLETREMSELKSDPFFYNTVEKFKKDISHELCDNGMFIDNPINTDIYYSVIGVVAFITFNFILAIICFLLGRKSARRTDLGIEKYSEAVSLKNFLVSQNDQINFQAENQIFFEKLLPYATAFGVERVWIKRFKDLTLLKPDWYEGDISSVNSFIVISSSLNSGIRSNISYMSSTRSSTGFSSGFSGGHSGGGGGGGGTGSW